MDVLLVCICAPHTCLVSMEPEEGIGPLETELKGSSCGLIVGLGNFTCFVVFLFFFVFFCKYRLCL